MQWILRFRVFIIISFAVVLITAAVIFSVLRAVLPHATGYKAEIQQAISQQIGLPVEIKSIDAAIHWFSPRLKLIGVSVYDEKNKVPLFNFREAFVELDVTASILRREIIVDDIGLIGADISIEKFSETEWSVQGININNEGSSELPEQFLYILQNADYLLHDSNIYYQDHTGEKLKLELLDVNIDVENNFNNHDIRFSMNLPEAYGYDLSVVADLAGDLDALSGDIYIETHRLNTKQWNKKFSLSDKFMLDAVVDIKLWVNLETNTIKTMFAQFDAEDLLIRNTSTSKSWKTDYLSSKVRYFYDKKHWNVAVSDFYFGDKEKPSWGQNTSLLVSDDELSYYLSAEFLRLHDVLPMAEVFLDSEQLPDLKKLKSYQVQADVYNLNLQLPKDISQQSLLEKLSIDASVLDFSMLDKINNLKLSGLDAAFQVANKQVVIDIDTQDASVELLNLFRRPLVADTIQGELTIKYDGVNWQLNAENLQLKNKHINLFTRLQAKNALDENIFVDMQTDIYDAYGKYANHYLPVGIMTKDLIDWLDMAVTDGYVPDGKFVLRGNLNEFPFEKHTGVFQVLFTVQDVEMQFLEGWPLLTETAATIKFHNQSLFVSNAKGKTQNAKLFNGYAEILDLDKPHLTVITEGYTSTKNLQTYVWNSGLDEVLGDDLRQFRFEGDSGLNLKLDIPLDEQDVDVKIDGHLNFSRTAIVYPALDYKITDINGRLDFTKDTISAAPMKAKINDQPVSISAITRDSIRNSASGSEVVFHLDGVIDADYLLQRYRWIPQRWISGRSNWAIDIELPYKTVDYLAHIKASSDLKDVNFQLSDAAHKPVGDKIPFSLDIDVLDNNALYVAINTATADVVSLSDDIKVDKAITDNLLKLNAVRDEKYFWTFDIASKYITGKGKFSEGLEKDKKVKLDLENVDIHSLFYTKNKEDSSRLNPADIPPLSWKAKTVLRDKWVLSDAVLETDWNKHGMIINKLSLKGPEMNFDAHGTWLTSWRGTHETVLQGTVSGGNIGKALTGLDFQKGIDRSEYKATFDSKWPAELYELSWANMKGKMTFDLEKGEIVDVDPGTGARLLGLLNIFKIANRLIFDFDDVTRDGFAFDYIKGEFEFVNGDGSLKDVDISGPAADINMFGSIGMVKRDYGLLMRVKPHTDSLTFAGGALLGGVVVGAGLALIQKIFNLGAITHNVYSITGSWDDPQVEKIVERSLDEDTTDNIDDDDDF